MPVRVGLHALRSLSLPPHGSLQCLREQEFAGSWMSCHKAWLPLGRVPQKADSEVEIYTEQVPRRSVGRSTCDRVRAAGPAGGEAEW